MYHLTELLRDYDTKINIARYLYLLSRMEPERESSTEVKMRIRNSLKNVFVEPESKGSERITYSYLSICILKSQRGGGVDMKLTEENYVETAEKAIKEICGKKDRRGRTVAPVTTSKIRNLLAMTAAIYNDVIVCTSEKLSTEIVGRIQYMKIRFVYEAGREPKVKELVEKHHFWSIWRKSETAGRSICYLAVIWRHWLRIVNFTVATMNRRKENVCKD